MKYLIFIVVFLLIQTAHAQHGESQGISFSFTRVVYSDTDSKGVFLRLRMLQQSHFLSKNGGAI